jgi:adenylosuccinate lyase
VHFGSPAVRCGLHRQQIVSRSEAHVAHVIDSTVLDFQVIENQVSTGDALSEILSSLARVNGSATTFQDDMIILDSGAYMKVSVCSKWSFDSRREFCFLHKELPSKG